MISVTTTSVTISEELMCSFHAPHPHLGLCLIPNVIIAYFPFSSLAFESSGGHLRTPLVPPRLPSVLIIWLLPQLDDFQSITGLTPQPNQEMLTPEESDVMFF